jgi:predicted amidohydrolase
MRVYLSRFVCRDVEANLARVMEEAGQAVGAGARLVVFPESFLHGYTRTADTARVRDVFAEVSAAHADACFVFGTFTEAGRNRLTVWRGGRRVAAYDKVHLFGPNREEDLWQEGDRYAAVRFAGWTVGLLTCNDVRFPEQARALRLQAGCDALVAVAWWPWRRDHIWRTLLRARAIENGAWALGCCVAASEHPGEYFAGAGNHVFDPFGEPVRTPDDHLYELYRDRAAALLVDPAAAYRQVDRVEVFETEAP